MATQSTTQPLPLPLDEAMIDWQLFLRAQNRSPATIASYLEVGNDFLKWLESEGHPTDIHQITRQHINLYRVAMQTRPSKRDGKPISQATVAKHHRSLQQLFRFLTDPDEGIGLFANPMQGMKPPQVEERPVPFLTEDELDRLFAACKGNRFEDLRDRALFWVLLDTGTRRSEALRLTKHDIDWTGEPGAKVMGKGSRQREVWFGPQTQRALRAYLRVRAAHPFAHCDELWLGKQGPLGIAGIRGVLRRRGITAGIDHLHPHKFRHTAAHLAMLRGMQDGDVMVKFGWKSRQMLAKYGATGKTIRAHEAQKQLWQSHPKGY